MCNSSLKAFLLVLAVPAAAAAPLQDGPNRWVSPRLDSTPVVVEDAVHGQAWAAWTYANSGELDIALSSRDADGRWSAPVFLGSGDGIDQFDPALVVDGRGVVYVAYAERGARRIQIAALPSPFASWRSVATIETASGTVATPSLKVIGDRLVVAFRAGREVQIHDFPLIALQSTRGIDDGPDPFGNGPSGDGSGGSPMLWKPKR